MRLALLALALSAVRAAAAEFPIWTVPDGKLSTAHPVDYWMSIPGMTGEGGAQLWTMFGPHLPDAVKDLKEFTPPYPGYQACIPLFTLTQNGSFKMTGAKYTGAFQAEITDFWNCLKIKTEGTKKKVESMTIVKLGDPSFQRPVDLKTGLLNIGVLMGGDGIDTKVPHEGKKVPAAVFVTPPTVETWVQWVFKEGAVDKKLWVYMPEFQRGMLGKPEFKSTDPAFDIAVPMYEVAAKGAPEVGHKSTLLRFAKTATPYKLYIKRLEAKKYRWAVKSGTTLVHDYGTTIPRPMNIGLLAGGNGTDTNLGGKVGLADVRAPSGPPPPGISDYELSMVGLMPAELRDKALAECKDQPAKATGPGPLLDCWRKHIKEFLKAYKDKAVAGGFPPTEFDPFELAYIRQRLGEADFKKFQEQFAKAQKAGRALDFVKAWRDRIVKEVDGYINSVPGSVYSPKGQLESIERLLIACDPEKTAETLKFCGNTAWGGRNDGSVVDGSGSGRTADDLSGVPGGDRRVSLAMKEPPTIGADKGPGGDEKKKDKNEHVNMMQGVQLGVFGGFLAFLLGLAFPGILLAAVFGMALGWMVASYNNR